jgi:hypothetical protein
MLSWPQNPMPVQVPILRISFSRDPNAFDLAATRVHMVHPEHDRRLARASDKGRRGGVSQLRRCDRRYRTL